MEEYAVHWIFALLFLGLMVRGHVFAHLLGVKKITVHELSERLSKKPRLVLIDVRTPVEYQAGHAPNSVPIPLSELKSRVDEVKSLVTNDEVAVVCRSGQRSTSGSVILKRAGIETVYNVTGGMLQWESQGYPVRK